MTIDIEALSPRELQALIVAAEKRRQLVTTRRPIAAVRRTLAAVAAQAGYAVEELFGPAAAAPEETVRKRARRKLGKAAPKYRDPENKRNTWSGRGSMPRWLAEKTKRGRSAADFLIPGLARPTERKKRPVGQRTVFKQS